MIQPPPTTAAKEQQAITLAFQPTMQQQNLVLQQANPNIKQNPAIAAQQNPYQSSKGSNKLLDSKQGTKDKEDFSSETLYGNRVAS